jgi:hypothetical protein
MNNIEIGKQLLISSQRALLGAIYPEIRAIAIGFDGLKKLTIKMFLDRAPKEDDYDTLSDISGEILADMDFKEVDEICEFNTEKPIPLNGLHTFIYVRKESA